MIATIFVSPSLTEFLSTAAIGGAIVLLGHCMEKTRDKEWYRNVSDFRRSKSFGKWGARLVKTGIVVEISVAVWFAFDEWENNPLNKPVVNIDASVDIEVLESETNMEKIHPIHSWQIVQANLVFETHNTKILFHNFNLYANALRPGEIRPFVSGNVSIKDNSVLKRKTYFGYDIQFQYNDPFVFSSEENIKIPTVKEFRDNFDDIEIINDFIPSNTEVVGGHGNIKINGNIQEGFEILPQQTKLNDYMGGSTVITATNFVTKFKQ